jgi:hypothetical protein
MRREEMTSQLQIQRKESRVHQQMMNVMLMAMMQNIAGTNQQQRTDIGGANDHQRTEIGGIISRSRSARQISRTMRATSKPVNE